MAVVASVLSIVVLAVLLHVILYFVFKIDARQLLVAATLASLVIVFVMMLLYRSYNLSPSSVLLLLFALAVISALAITFGEQYFALFPQKRTVGDQAASGSGEGGVAAAPEPTPEPAVPQLGVVSAVEPAVVAEPVSEPPPVPVPTLTVEAVAPLAGPLPDVGEAPAIAAADTVARAAPVSTKDEEEIARLLDEGYDKINKGDFKGALESFQLAIIFVDELDILAKLRVEMGRLWFMQEQPSMARTELQEALRISQRAENKALEEEIRELLENL